MVSCRKKRAERLIVLSCIIMLSVVNVLQVQAEETKLGQDNVVQKNEINTNMLASFLKRAGKFQEAALLYHDISEKTDWAKGRAQYLNQEAQIYWEVGDYSKAKDMFTYVWETGAKELKAASQEQVKEGNNRQARSVVITFIQIDQAGFNLANIKRIQGDIPGAVKIYQIIEKESPLIENKRRAVFGQAQLKVNQGQLDEGLQTLTTLLADLKKATDSLNKTDRNEEGRFSRREQSDQNFNTPMPEDIPLIDSERVLLALTEIYEKQKAYPKLIETYTALANDTKQFAKKQIYLYLLAKANLNAGQKEGAIKAYSGIVEEEETRMKKQEEFFSKRKDKSATLPPIKMGPLGLMAQEEIKKLGGK